MERFCVALTSRFCAAEFSNRSICVSLVGWLLMLLMVLFRLDGVTRIEDDVLLTWVVLKKNTRVEIKYSSKVLNLHL